MTGLDDPRRGDQLCAPTNNQWSAGRTRYLSRSARSVRSCFCPGILGSCGTRLLRAALVLPLHTAFPAHTRRCGGTWSYGPSWLHARRLRLRLKLLSRRCRPTSMDMGAGLSCRTWPSSLTCLHVFSRDCRALLSALDRMAPNLFFPTEITSRCLTGEPSGSQCSVVPGKHPHLPLPGLAPPPLPPLSALGFSTPGRAHRGLSHSSTSGIQIIMAVKPSSVLYLTVGVHPAPALSVP